MRDPDSRERGIGTDSANEGGLNQNDNLLVNQRLKSWTLRATIDAACSTVSVAAERETRLGAQVEAMRLAAVNAAVAEAAANAQCEAAQHAARQDATLQVTPRCTLVMSPAGVSLSVLRG